MEKKTLQNAEKEKRLVSAIDTMSIESIERSVETAERYMNALNSIRKMAINMTNQLDWVDENGTPYLQKAGCDKIAGGFGIRSADVTCEKEKEEDKNGQYVTYTYSGNGMWMNNVTHEIGTASSRDAFFANRTVNGERIKLPLDEVNCMDVKKKAHTNMMNRLIKRLLGLSFTWEEIEQISNGRITRQGGARVTYDKGKKGGNTMTSEQKNERTEIANRILALVGGDKPSAENWLENETKFTTKDGKNIAGKRSMNDITDKQIPFIKRALDKAEKELDESINQMEVENG